MNKNIIGMVFAILALVFIIIGLFGSWYSSHMEMSLLGSSSMISDSDVYLTRIEGSSGYQVGARSIQSMDLSEIREQYESAGMDTSFIDAIGNSFIVTIVALIFGIIAMVFAIISILKSKFKIIAGILSILVFVFAILAPIIFMTGFTSFVEAQASSYSSSAGDIGFWFSTEENGVKASMGPGYAWYLMIIGAIFALIGGIILFLKQKQPVPFNAVPMQQQAPPVSPPMQ